MESRLQVVLVILQIAFFVFGRVLDDLTWFHFGLENEISVFEGSSIACLLICVGLQMIRKRNIDGIWLILFLRSQLAFFIAWALEITIIVLYVSIFSCKNEQPEGSAADLFMNYDECCWTVIQLILTNFNYSLICNTKAQRPEFFAYQLVTFGEIIFDGHLLLRSVNNLEHTSKEYAILLLSIIIANQVLIMDLIFRAAYEEREHIEAKEEEMVGFYRKTFHRATRPFSRGIELTTTLNNAH